MWYTWFLCNVQEAMSEFRVFSVNRTRGLMLLMESMWQIVSDMLLDESIKGTCHLLNQKGWFLHISKLHSIRKHGAVFFVVDLVRSSDRFDAQLRLTLVRCCVHSSQPWACPGLPGWEGVDQRWRLFETVELAADTLVVDILIVFWSSGRFKTALISRWNIALPEKYKVFVFPL